MAKKTKESSLTATEQEYQLEYGGLPKTQDELLSYIEENYHIDPDKLQHLIDDIKAIQWRSIHLEMDLVPKPTPRPRMSTSGFHFYVKNAAENRKLIRKYIERNIIYTRAEIDIKAYVPTPRSSMTNLEIYLAEAGLIAPMKDPDVDNLMKTYLDMAQGHLLLNDNVVTRGTLEKFFSLKPRLVIDIRYQDRFDSKYNKRRVENSKKYQDMIQEYGATDY